MDIRPSRSIWSALLIRSCVDIRFRLLLGVEVDAGNPMVMSTKPESTERLKLVSIGLRHIQAIVETSFLRGEHANANGDQ